MKNEGIRLLTFESMVAAIVLVVLFLFRAWLAMLAIGALHTYWPEIPPLGFTATAWLTALATILVPPSTDRN